MIQIQLQCPQGRRPGGRIHFGGEGQAGAELIGSIEGEHRISPECSEQVEGGAAGRERVGVVEVTQVGVLDELLAEAELEKGRQEQIPQPGGETPGELKVRFRGVFGTVQL